METLTKNQVSKNKTQTEALITNTLAQIKNSLPGIRLYQRVHDDGGDLSDQLQDKIWDLYLAFIEFSIEAINYYQQSGLG